MLTRPSAGPIHNPLTASSSQTSAESSQDRSHPKGTPQTSGYKLPHTVKSFPRLPKAPLSRRTTSSIVHRSKIFSADDEPHEVEGDDLVRQGYSTRPRSQQATATLSRLQSYRAGGDGEDEQETLAGGVPTTTTEEQELEHSDDLPLEEHVDCDSDGEISEAESFTLKDRQQAINQTHPFGIRVWKPALYKKDRSIQRFARADIRPSPGGRVTNWLLFFNIVWTLVFGWWMAAVAALGAVVCFLFAAARSGKEYGRVLWGLAGFLFYPFGKFCG